jgi:hypothetical protein
MIVTFRTYQQILIKLPSVEFHENPVSNFRVVSYIRTDGLSDFISHSTGVLTEALL